MPLKNGELSGPEIRVLIRGHNKLAQIKVPTGLDRDGLIKFLKSKKYTVDHKKKRLVDDISGGSSRGRKVTLATAKAITKPKPKTDEQKAATKAKKDMKTKATKDKEDAIKAEGVKQGAALQKVVSKRVKAKAKPKEDEVRPKEKVGKVKFDPKKVKVVGVKEKTKPAPAPAPAPAQTSDESKREAGRARLRANQKIEEEIFKELKIPTLKEYRAEIKKISGGGNINEKKPAIRKEIAAYADSVVKILKKFGQTDATTVRNTKKNLQTDVGNVDRHFGFLGEKLRKEREEKTGGSSNDKEGAAVKKSVKSEIAPVPAPAQKKTKQEKVDEKRDKEQAENNKVFENKIVPLVVKDVTPVVLDWLKKAPELESTLKDKDGNPIKRTKGARKPLYIKEKEKFGKIIFGILADIYDEFNFRKPNTDQARSLLDGKLSSWGKYGGVPAAITKAKAKEEKTGGSDGSAPKSKLEKELMKFQMAEKLIKEFLDDNKGWENKDYSSLKNLSQYEDTFKNYDKYLKAYNTLNVMKSRREFNRERVEKLRDEIVKVRNEMRKVYDNRTKAK